MYAERKGGQDMGRQLKTMILNGKEVKEAGCGDYVCRYCGGKATALNFVADMCLQVYAKHEGMCGAYADTEKYRGYVTDCSTCKHQVEGECLL